MHEARAPELAEAAHGLADETRLTPASAGLCALSPRRAEDEVEALRYRAELFIKPHEGPADTIAPPAAAGRW